MIFATESASESKSVGEGFRDRLWKWDPHSVSDSEPDFEVDPAQVTRVSLRAGRRRAPEYRQAPIVVSVSLELEDKVGMEELRDVGKGRFKEARKYL